MSQEPKRYQGFLYESQYSKLALMLLCASGMTAAIGQQVPVQPSEKSAPVTVADLDLSTEQGMQAARDRLHEKARWLCARLVNPLALSHQPDFVHCVDESTANAVKQLQGPVLVANAKGRALRQSSR